MDKVILTKQEHKENNGTKPVFIDMDLYKQITDLKAETGIPIRQIVNKLVEFGIENVEVQGVE